MMRRVVVTGLGIWSCIGTSLDTVRNSLYEGLTGIGLVPERKEFGYRSSLSGIVPAVSLKGVLDRKARMFLAEEGEYAYMSTIQALEDAGIDKDYLMSHEVGVLFGNDSSSKSVIESNDIAREKKDTNLVGPAAVFQSMNSTVTMNLATILGLKGINFTVSAACASGSHSIGIGTMFIRNGLQDMIICGGAQETNIYSMGSFDGINAFSVREDAPAKASRPFDRDRDGLVPSGGAASLIIEEYEHALRRGAKIYAEIIGYGFSSNGTAISLPDADGSLRAMKRAMGDAGVSPSDIDYINAHATSTPHGDAAEAKALSLLFSRFRTAISSTKSMTGHECWMSGASEVVYSILMMRDSFIAPNINFENPDDFSKDLNIVPETVEVELKTVLSNSFGFGGTNSALILRKI